MLYNIIDCVCLFYLDCGMLSYLSIQPTTGGRVTNGRTILRRK